MATPGLRPEAISCRKLQVWLLNNQMGLERVLSQACYGGGFKQGDLPYNRLGLRGEGIQEIPSKVLEQVFSYRDAYSATQLLL